MYSFLLLESTWEPLQRVNSISDLGFDSNISRSRPTGHWIVWHYNPCFLRGLWVFCWSFQKWIKNDEKQSYLPPQSACAAAETMDGEKSAKSSTESSSNLFCGLFHVRFLDFDHKFEKFRKFCTKAILFILKHFLKRENERHELVPRNWQFRGTPCPTFSRPALT